MKYQRSVNQSILFAVIVWLTAFMTVLYYTTQYSQKPYGFQFFDTRIEPDLNKDTLNDTLVNLHGFKYVINNVSLCMRSASEGHSSIAVMVHSARSNINQRYAIRNTWGSVKKLNEWHFHLIFLLGIGNENDPQELDQKLWDESKLHGDMIMGNFVDSYHNLTYKHLMGYKWVSTFCPTAKFILKTDDDVFVDIFQVVEVVLVELNNSQNAFACLNMKGNGPQRSELDKWYLSKSLYPDDLYPEFCSGVGYLMRADAAAKIYSVSNKTTFIWIDDAFVTGILREKYDFLATNSTNSSLNILSLQYIYNFKLDFKTPDMIKWCNTGMESNQLVYTYIILEDRVDFIRNLFCIWNKVRLLRFAVNNVIGGNSTTPKFV